MCLARTLIFISPAHLWVEFPPRLKDVYKDLNNAFTDRFVDFGGFIPLLYKQRYTCNEENGPGV